MIDHLCNNSSYRNLDKNPLKTVLKVVSLTITYNNYVSSISHKLIESNPFTPKIYGLPKIHEEGDPLRPIVNIIGGPTYLLAKYLVWKLKPLVGHTHSFVKDSSSFFNELKGINFELIDIMVSFDVVSLYTNIPINKVVDVINHITNPNTTKLVEVCLTSTFFNFEDEFYKQTYGVSMGSLTPLVVANLFMEDF